MAIYCEKCGATLEPGRKFCNQCGAMQGQAGSSAPQTAPQPQQMQMPAAPPAGSHGGQMAPSAPPKASGQTIALYDQDYDQALPSRPPQAPPPQPFAPKSQQEVFAPKPQAVYPPQAPPAYPPRPAYPAAASAKGGDSFIVTLGLLLLANIPVLGLIPAILMGFNPDAGQRGVLMKAMIVVNLVWAIVLGVLIYQFYAILTQVADVNIYWFWQ